METELRRKKASKSNLTKLKDRIKSTIDTVEDIEIEELTTKVNALSNELKDIFGNITVKCEEKDLDQYITESQGVEDIIDELVILLKRRSKALNPNDSKVSVSKAIQFQEFADLKLPKLTLPTFSGKIEEWMTFCDLFTASIHNNGSLSDAQKLQYLKASCKADALKIIYAIPISDANYAIAWNLLKERYSNNRELIHALIKRLTNHPCIPDSAQAILHLVDVVNECKRSLEVLKQTIEGFSDVLLVYLIVEKLDRNTRLWWERSLKIDELGTLEKLTLFLKEHARTLQNTKAPLREQRRSPTSKTIALVSEKVNQCLYCKGDHPLLRCSQFLNLTTSKRINFVKFKGLCFNCLSQLHQIKNCKSASTCRKCKKFHHTLLHIDRLVNDVDTPDVVNQNKTNKFEGTSLSPEAATFTPHSLWPNVQGAMDSLPEDKQTMNDAATSVSTQVFTASSKTHKHVFLATAVVYLKSGRGNYIPCRALLDSGAQNNFLTIECADRIKTKRERICASVCGLNQTMISIKSSTTAVISNAQDFSKSLQFYIVPKITRITPPRNINIPRLNEFNAMKLADPEFYKPGKIDMLLGNEVFFELLRASRIRIDCLILQETVFGYIISGSANEVPEGSNDTYCGLVQNLDNLSATLKSFWEIESIKETESVKSEEERFCEEHFLRTHSRTEDGRYVVKMPIKENSLTSLGDSREEASRRLNAVWKRLLRDPVRKSLYEDFINEYESLGHMEKVVENGDAKLCYYLPHHGVYKPEKTSSKLRVVFDGSAETTSGVSLNDLLLNGGVVQEDLFSIIARFRIHRYAFTADIKKMYRQILIHPDQRDLQRILWKTSASSPVKIYQLRTITYGTANAPFLATRTLKQLALDEKEDFPLAAAAALTDFYVDDILSGSDSLSEARELQLQLIHLLQRGGMQLHKWCASHPALLNDCTDREEYSFSQPYKDHTVKTLGLLWNPEKDCFSFRISIKEPAICNKRTVLSDISRIFDPLGLLGPAITKAKIFLQKLWLLKIDWDDALPNKELKEWQKFVATMHSMNCISINRYVLSENPTEIQIHGFADASEQAYGAAVYLRSITCSQITSNLLCSKSRVAPIKSVTIPRLELCAAVLLSQLVSKIVKSLNLRFSKVYLWSDSTIVLAWIHSAPHLLKTFVANRVVKVQELTSSFQWNHVRSELNPADLLSRGMYFNNIQDSELWCHGPSFLTESIGLPNTNNINSDFTSEQTEEFSQEVKKQHNVELVNIATIATLKDSCDLTDIILHISNNYSKNIRILSYIFRFVHNLKRSQDKVRGPMTSSEFRAAEQYLLQSVQQKEFKVEFSLLSQGKEVSNKSKLRSLHPFLDKDKLIRVGGRLTNAYIDYDNKHQVILPKNHKLTNLIFQECHRKNFHVGPQSLLCFVRQRFWPLSGKNIARKTVHDCVTCFRHKPSEMTQLMGNLPRERVNPCSTFINCGIDFCGPFLIKYKGQRKGMFHKIYVAVFICLAVKAIHLEIVSDLTSQAFIACLKRFFSRRGKSAKIFSDNAKTFVGANRELKQLNSLLYSSEELHSYLVTENISWKFIPPRAPNFGGLWESGVKSFKFHFKRAVGNATLLYEEFLTVMTQVEGMLNSRPISPMSLDAPDFEPLTPGHFLVGRPINAIPEPNLTEVQDTRLSRWQRLTKFTQQIWKRWARDYLNHLQQRSKWQFEKENVKTGTVVLLKEENLPPNQWLMGIIQELIYGPDKRVRVVLVKAKSGILKRPISKICILPVNG